MSCDRLWGTNALDAMAAADHGERARLAAHLATGCELCAARRAEFAATLAALVLLYEAAVPGPSLRRRLLFGLHPAAGRGVLRRFPSRRVGD